MKKTHSHQPEIDSDDQAKQSTNIPIHNRFMPLNVEEVNTQTEMRSKQSENNSNIVLIGDSMIKNINPRKLSRKRVNKFTFPGKTAQEISAEIPNINMQSPRNTTHVIIHAGTNNLPMDSSSKCMKNIKGLCTKVKERFPDAKLGFSSIIQREDIDVTGKINEVNTQIEHLCKELGFAFINNSIIDESGLNGSKLHLNAKGSALLATRFIKFLNPNKQVHNQTTAAGNHIYSENFLRDLLNLVALTQTPMPIRRRTR